MQRANISHYPWQEYASLGITVNMQFHPEGRWSLISTTHLEMLGDLETITHEIPLFELTKNKDIASAVR